MKKTLLILSIMTTQIAVAQTIYDFKIKGLDGKTIDMADYKGKNIMIVNTASECGYTPQYEGLEKLYEQYKGKLVIIGVPANNFGGQEPGTNSEIATFCSKTYNVTFPMAAKESVKGADINPFFKWLIEQKNPDFTGDIKWNFEKFLFNEKGELVHRYRSGVKPMSEEITSNL